MRSRRDDLSTTPLTAAVTATIRALTGELRAAHGELWARWLDVVGRDMYQRCFPKALRGTTLTVGVSSSSWLHELSFVKPALLDKIAEEIGPGIVAEIRFVLDPDLAAERIAEPTRVSSAPSPPPRRPLPEALREEVAASIPDPELRAALERAMGASRGGGG